MGKSMSPHLQQDSGDKTGTHQLEPYLSSAATQPGPPKYILLAAAWKQPLQLLRSFLHCVQRYSITFIHTTSSKIKTSPSICTIHQKWTMESNAVLLFFTKQSELRCLTLLGYLCREKLVM